MPVTLVLLAGRVRRADRGGHPAAARRHGGDDRDLAAGHPEPLAADRVHAPRRSCSSSGWRSASTTPCSTCAGSGRSGPRARPAPRRCGSRPATSGRAIVVSGLTVMIALAGLFLTGYAMFTGIAIGTIVVVGVAVAGSLTVLPALLSWLGGRGPTAAGSRSSAARRTAGPAVPGVGRPGPPGGAPPRRPGAAIAALALLALAAPALGLRLGSPPIDASRPSCRWCRRWPGSSRRSRQSPSRPRSWSPARDLSAPPVTRRGQRAGVPASASTGPIQRGRSRRRR